MRRLTAIAPTAAVREFIAAVRRVERAVMVVVLRRIGQLNAGAAAHGVPVPRPGVDDGILPAALAQSGGWACQNRVTGHPRSPLGRYGTTGPSAGKRTFRRRISGLPRAVPGRVSKDGLVPWNRAQLPGYPAMSHLTVSVRTRYGLVRCAVHPVEQTVTPLIRGSGRVCGAPARMYLPRPAGQPAARGTYAVPAHPSSTRSGHPQLMKT